MKNKTRSNPLQNMVFFFVLFILVGFIQVSFAQSADLKDRNSYRDASGIHGLTGLNSTEEDDRLMLIEKLEQITRNVFGYFHLDNRVVFGPVPGLWSKPGSAAQKDDLDASGLKVFMNVDYDENSSITMDAIQLNNQWTGNYINTIYHYGKNQFELGFGSKKINELLPDNVKMEIKTNPQAGSAAILFTMEW